MLKPTPLYEQHKMLGAKMTEFCGWEMPLDFGSQLEEHHIVRRDSGLFDVSHMTIVDVLGAGGRLFLRHLLANDVDSLKQGQAMYSCMLNQHGGVIDDLIVYHRSFDNYRLVLNAATRTKDLDWIYKQAQGFSVGLLEQKDFAILAVQGPKAIEKVLSAVSPEQMDAITTLRPFDGVDIGDWFVARTGYTGEDGLEFIVPKAQAQQLWSSFVAHGITPCGLGARDSLRLEAGMLLYGQDMDELTTPLECGLSWTVKLDDHERDFIGRGALLAQKHHGITKKLVGLVLEDKGILRAGQKVILSDNTDGVITSGGFSPTLSKSIAFASVPLSIGNKCKVEIRGKRFVVKVVKPRFVKQGQALV